MLPFGPAVLSLLLSACGGPLSDGQSLFERGHYAEAKQRLASMEVPGRRWTVAERARFALYRGLTFGALGDLPRATPWLREARELQDEHPGALDTDDALRLAAAIDTYVVR